MDNCAEHATCTDIEGTYSCSCDIGYTGDGTECIGQKSNTPSLLTYRGTFTDVNECELQVGSCDENANCTNTDGGHNCYCLPGYSGNGTYCYGNKIIIIAKGEVCDYTLLSDLDIDECTTDMDNCAQKATCTNTDGSFSCTCDDGYTGYGVVCYGQLSWCKVQ